MAYDTMIEMQIEASSEHDTTIVQIEEPLEHDATTNPDLPSQTQEGYRSDVDGLRAVAVVMVIVYHLHRPWLPGGFMGVDIFFVISGFVCTRSLLSRPQASHFSELVADFYIRRIRRLAPALLVSAFVTAISISVLIPPTIDWLLREYYITLQLALLGVVNHHFATMPVGGYWQRGFETLEYNPFTHLWSLAVESQFYLVFPWLIALAYGRRVSLLRHPWPSPRFAPRRCHPASLLVISFLLSLALSAGHSATGHRRLAFYQMPARLWQLMTGAMLFEWQSSSGRCRRTWLRHASTGTIGSLLLRAGLELLVLGCLAAALGWTRIDSFLPVPHSIPAVAAAVLFIAIGTLPPRRWACGLPSPLLNALASQRGVEYIGRISYPLYLVHWPVFVGFRWTPLGLDSPPAQLAAVALSIALAMSTHHWLEPTVAAWKPRWRAQIPLAFLLATCSLQVLLQALRGPLYGSLYGSMGSLGIRDPNNNSFAVPLSSLGANGSAHNGVDSCRCSNSPHGSTMHLGWQQTFHSPPDADPTAPTPCFVAPPASSSTPIHDSCYFTPDLPAALSSLEGGFAEGLGSDLTQGAAAPRQPDGLVAAHPEQLTRCLTPPAADPSVPRSNVLFLVGDSHCAVLREALRRATAGRMRVVSACMLGVPFGPPQGTLPRTTDPPAWWYPTLVDTLSANMRPGDGLVVVQLGALQSIGFLRDTVLAQITRPNRASLIILGDNPLITRPAPTCKANPALCDISPWATDAGRDESARADVERSLAQFAEDEAKSGDVFVWSQTSLWTSGAPGEHLWGNVPGTHVPGYYDTNHLLVDVAEAYLWPYLCAAFHRWGLFRE